MLTLMPANVQQLFASCKFFLWKKLLVYAFSAGPKLFGRVCAVTCVFAGLNRFARGSFPGCRFARGSPRMLHRFLSKNEIFSPFFVYRLKML
jgi:hypothetical protein